MRLSLRTGAGIAQTEQIGKVSFVKIYLGEMIMLNQTSTTSAIHPASISTTISKPLQLISAMILGIVILYGAGFVQTSVAHNAAHDMRHSQGFPCH